jgi:hypothetical protein
MVCPKCGGKGCDECGDLGRFEIKGCPLDYAGNEIWNVLDYANLLETGIPPVHGGLLDQVWAFAQAALFIKGEKEYWKNRLGIING